jgi:hypothetical protein
MRTSIARWVQRRDPKRATHQVDGRKNGRRLRLHRRADTPKSRHPNGHLGHICTNAPLAGHRENPCRSIFGFARVARQNGPTANPGLLDPLSFRRHAPLAPLSMRATGGKIVQGIDRLLLPAVLRQSVVREPSQEHSKPTPFRGLQAAATPRRGRFAHRTIPGTAARHAPENVCAAAAPCGAIGGSDFPATYGQAHRLPKFGLLFAASNFQMI